LSILWQAHEYDRHHRSRAERGRGEDGFTVVELLVAMSLFGVVLAAVAGVFISSARSVGDQRLRTAATRLASDHLETLRSLPFAELDLPATLAPTSLVLHGTTFHIGTAVRLIDAATGAASLAEGTQELKEITATVTWTAPGGGARTVSYATAIGADPRAALAVQAIGSITMFPSPATTGADGRPLQDIEVTVPMDGFTVGTLVNISWTNRDGTAGAKTLTSTTGLNWRGTIAKEQVVGDLVLGGVTFTISAGTLSAIYSLALLAVVSDPPVITGATIDRNPIIVARPTGSRTCAAANQCRNTTDVVFFVTTTGLDHAKDSVIVQFQLHDSTFVELPLAPVSGESGHWRLTVRQNSTKFQTGLDRAIRFTAIRTADSTATIPVLDASAGFTLLRTVMVAL
jgi:prepilin-type N-terminal cleavage/methylation domain-containing protein